MGGGREGSATVFRRMCQGRSPRLTLSRARRGTAPFQSVATPSSFAIRQPQWNRFLYSALARSDCMRVLMTSSGIVESGGARDRNQVVSGSQVSSFGRRSIGLPPDWHASQAAARQLGRSGWGGRTDGDDAGDGADAERDAAGQRLAGRRRALHELLERRVGREPDRAVGALLEDLRKRRGWGGRGQGGAADDGRQQRPGGALRKEDARRRSGRGRCPGSPRP